MLKDLIRKGESETLEFRESLGEWKEIIQVVTKEGIGLPILQKFLYLFNHELAGMNTKICNM